MTSHSFPIRVYYEDTDHGGVVYYANYLKFMERGRTEFLRALSIQLDAIHQQEGVMFAVTHADIHYRAPARFNDALMVKSRLIQAKGARLAFQQSVWRTSEINDTSTLLTQAEIQLACIDNDGKAARIPAYLLNMLQHHIHIEGEQP